MKNSKFCARCGGTICYDTGYTKKIYCYILGEFGENSILRIYFPEIMLKTTQNEGKSDIEGFDFENFRASGEKKIQVH